jgi:hypothetical protein
MPFAAAVIIQSSSMPREMLLIEDPLRRCFAVEEALVAIRSRINALYRRATPPLSHDDGKASHEVPGA